MSSLALLEPEIPYPLDVTGKNNVDVFLAYGCGGSDGGQDGAIFKQEVGIR